MPPVTLGQIAALLGCPPPPAGTADGPIAGVASLADAGPTDLSYVGSDKYLPDLAATAAGTAVVQRRVHLPREPAVPVLVVDDADLAIARVLELFAPPIPRPPAGVDPAARVDPSAVLGEQVAIGPFVFVGPGSRIGRGTVLHPGVYVGADVTVGAQCEFFPNVVVRERCSVGDRVMIHAGSVLGTDGFGYRWDGARHAKVPQIGTVIIEDDVEIGSCACVDPAKFSRAPRIGRGTKIDNLVQVGHNVRVGAHCIIVGQVGIAGSTTLGKGVVLGGQAALRDHIHVGDGASAAACAAIAEDVAPGASVSGMPALPHRQTLREQAALRHLPDLRVQVRKLQDEVNRLKAAIEASEG